VRPLANDNFIRKIDLAFSNVTQPRIQHSNMIFTNESDGRSTDAGSTKLGYM